MYKQRIKKLEDKYKKIPEVECKGLCYTSCVIVPASSIESKRARKRLSTDPFKPIKAAKVIKGCKIPNCRALKENRCSIYNIRPAICRLFGVAEGLECPYGCIPKEKMSKQEAHQLIKEIDDI